MAASRYVSYLLFILTLNLCTGVFTMGRLMDDQLHESNESDEPPDDQGSVESPDTSLLDNKRVLSAQNNLIPKKFPKKYKCHSCEAPDCRLPTLCEGALQCYKSRVRDTAGIERVERGCTKTPEQVPLLCNTQSHSGHTKRHTGRQYAISCCIGDFCNNGSFPELPRIVTPTEQAYDLQLPANLQQELATLIRQSNQTPFGVIHNE